MTVAARNTPPSTTDSANARVRVRESGNPRVVPIRPDTGDPSAYPRAIPRSPSSIKDDKPGKIRNFASQHAGEARQSLASSFLAQDRPQNLNTVAATLTRNPATWFRLTAYTIAYLICFAVDTNKRAAVTSTTICVALGVAWTLTAVHTH